MRRALITFIGAGLLFSGCITKYYITPEQESEYMGLYLEAEKQNKELAEQLENCLQGLENLQECP